MRSVLILALVVGCGGAAGQDGASPAPQPVATVGVCAPPPAIDSVALLRDVFALADDSMLGRHVGTATNRQARDYLASRFDQVGLESLPAGRLHRVPVIPSARVPVDHAWNVIGLLPGSDSAAGYIVITAHYDHVGVGRPVEGDSIYNGADDNASGAAALAVLARHFQDHPTRHTLIFAAVDAEERGMWGARGLLDPAIVPVGQMVLNVNMDMIGRNDRNELYAAGPGRYPQLRPLVEATARCAPLNLLMGHDTEAAGRGNDWTTQSDHAAFHRAGIPFVYFGVEDHPDYHRPSDHPDRLMPRFYVAAVQTVAELIRRADAAL